MANQKKILPDGSVEGETFSGKGYTHGYPPKKSGDTYRDWYNRCQEYKENGFHLGDLSWDDWDSYCLGFYGNEEYRQHELMN
ncbi:hypothetical protein SAMN05192529_13142 [Arachidicoccus rhizosphaerae]|uniref:Uncharacterized protein n=1 Tax=Arachidicoccus rhizosphaerae TaxID=551991 RepID=A0A1H4CG44_9BACT|nr:hypothetical protein [Arachidicoccus rhizosphaerae]SEA59405.1 hypothetical protein SAMN05192529_13142 [Arachidicoccus rhizosphaerae]